MREIVSVCREQAGNTGRSLCAAIGTEAFAFLSCPLVDKEAHKLWLKLYKSPLNLH